MTVDSAQFELTAAASGDLDLIHASQNRDVGTFEQPVQRHERKLPQIDHRVILNTGDRKGTLQ